VNRAPKSYSEAVAVSLPNRAPIAVWPDRPGNGYQACGQRSHGMPPRWPSQPVVTMGRRPATRCIPMLTSRRCPVPIQTTATEQSRGAWAAH
jgi:hypothetical protein